MSEGNVFDFPQKPASGRKLSSWIAGFMELTEGIQSPEAFRRWAAITAIAGAVERKVWILSQREIFFPNLYTFLVGPPGSGKTRAQDACSNIWDTLKGSHHVAPVKISKSSLVDVLFKSTRVVNGETFNSLLISIGELGALLPGYDPDFMNALTYIYDNKKYDEQFRNVHHGELLVIEKPQINLLACCTPSFLSELMPSGAWEQGFMSRVIVIYSEHDEKRPLDLLADDEIKETPLAVALAHDLRAIGEHYHRLKFTRDAADLIENWHMKKEDDGPDHPRLTNYRRRRTVNVLKLCMIAAMDHSNATEISVVDAQSAINWLIEAEQFMGDIFKAMKSGGDAQIIEEAWHMMREYNTRQKAPLPSQHLFRWLAERAPVHAIERMIETMTKSGKMQAIIDGGAVGYKAAGVLK
jgi:hypothetical protein